MDDKIRQDIQSTVELWKRFWGDNLHSIHLYGSFARGDWAKKSSDINLLILLHHHDYSRWEEAADIVKRKVKKGYAVPLVLDIGYLNSSTDVYPIEFLDIKLFHETFYGDDPFNAIELNPQDLRLQAEREIKGKWVVLRQAALEQGGNTPAMRDLLAMSVPTWVAVFQALLTIDGREVPADKREVLKQGAELAGADPEVFNRIEQLRRENKALNRSGAWKLLRQVLEQVDLLGNYADTLTVNS